MKLMPSCREVRDHLTEYHEGALPFWDRAALRFHLLLCTACAGFDQGLRALPAMAKRLLAHGLEAAPPEALKALDGALRRISADRHPPAGT
jgi:hypothetical protein